MRFNFKSIAVFTALVAANVVSAGTMSVSGSVGGMDWTATKMLTGVTHTGGAGAPGGNTAGDPIYHPSYPAHSGVVHLVMDYGPQIGAFICSGSLLQDRRSILTAAHCVSDGAGSANPLSTTVYFQPEGGLPAGTRIQTNFVPIGGAVTRNVTNYFVHNLYSGQVIDHNDIAVLRLDGLAPDWATGYGLYTNNNLRGQHFNVAGYGRLGSGDQGANGFTARLRQGENEYDFRLGDGLFGTNWSTILGRPFDQIKHSWISDFDNGLAANDTSCRVAQAGNVAGAAGAAFCDLGVGAREVGVAGGDSGGPNFINGMLSAVNSFGLSFGSGWGDSDNALNSSFGEFSGYVPVYLHADFIHGKIPVPGTLVLVLGAGLVAPLVSKRRRLQ